MPAMAAPPSRYDPLPRHKIQHAPNVLTVNDYECLVLDTHAWPSERGKREGPGVKQGVTSSDATVSRSFVRKGLGTGRGSQVSRSLNLIGLGCC